jgi:hypothetical protein
MAKPYSWPPQPHRSVEKGRQLLEPLAEGVDEASAESAPAPRDHNGESITDRE